MDPMLVNSLIHLYDCNENFLQASYFQPTNILLCIIQSPLKSGYIYGARVTPRDTYTAYCFKKFYIKTRHRIIHGMIAGGGGVLGSWSEKNN